MASLGSSLTKALPFNSDFPLWPTQEMQSSDFVCNRLSSIKGLLQPEYTAERTLIDGENKKILFFPEQTHLARIVHCIELHMPARRDCHLRITRYCNSLIA